MNIRKKLILCIAGLLAVVLSLAGSGWYSTRSLGNLLAFATQTVSWRAVLASELRTDIVDMRAKQLGVLTYALTHETKRVELNRKDFREFVKQAKETLATLQQLPTSEEGGAMLVSIGADLDKYSAYFEQISSMIAAGKIKPAADLSRDQSIAIGTRMENAADEFIYLQKEQLGITDNASAAQTRLARWVAAVLVTLGLAAFGLILLVVRKITGQLRTLTSSLSDGATQIAAGSSQVSSSSQSLAQGASEQASSLEETSASAEEITSMTRQNAVNTIQAAELMTAVDQRVAEGNSTLGLMVASMKQITASSDKISKIIKVIDEIAFQTNILALNAAVEAARAGEAGMGFAVVADEVRNLAQRSAQAAKDTAALIQESISTSNEGSVQLQKVADVVGSITEAANKVKVLVDEVNIGSQEQAKGIEEIARALTEMDKVTQGTAAAAEESASASQEMSAQAQSLAQIVQELRTLAE
jgi:methyl-accepting chemotaxis protein